MVVWFVTSGTFSEQISLHFGTFLANLTYFKANYDTTYMYNIGRNLHYSDYSNKLD